MAADFAAQSEAIVFLSYFAHFPDPRQGGLSASRDSAVVPARRARRGGEGGSCRCCQGIPVGGVGGRYRFFPFRYLGLTPEFFHHAGRPHRLAH